MPDDQTEDDLGDFDEFRQDSTGDSDGQTTDHAATDEAQTDGDANAKADDPTDYPDPDELHDHGEEIPPETHERLQDLRGRVEDLEASADRLLPVDDQNPTGVDPRPGLWDLCFDRAKPGARVYVVDVLSESIPDYRENYPDAPELDSYEGNVLSRMREADRVLAAIYVKDTLTSVDYTAYPMPESRLTRLPAEEASLVGRGSVEFARPPVSNANVTRGPDGEEGRDA